MDLAPTFMDAAGVAIPDSMTGRSLLPVFESADSGLVDASRTFVVLGRERHVAAAREGRTVPFDDVVAYCLAAITEAHETGMYLLIEGIGGVMVPLDETRTVADLIAELGIPAIVVGASYLGSLRLFRNGSAGCLRKDSLRINRRPRNRVEALFCSSTCNYANFFSKY